MGMKKVNTKYDNMEVLRDVMDSKLRSMRDQIDALLSGNKSVDGLDCTIVFVAAKCAMIDDITSELKMAMIAGNDNFITELFDSLDNTINMKL